MRRRILGVLAVATAVVVNGCGPRHDATGPQAVPTGAVLMDKVVAVVETRPITCSEVVLEARLHLAAEGDCAGALESPVPFGNLRIVLYTIVDRSLILATLRAGNEVEAQEVAAEMKDIQASCGPVRYRALLDLVELTHDEVAARRERALEAERRLGVELDKIWRRRRTQIPPPPPGASEEDASDWERVQKVMVLEEIVRELRGGNRRLRVNDDLAGQNDC